MRALFLLLFAGMLAHAQSSTQPRPQSSKPRTRQATPKSQAKASVPAKKADPRRYDGVWKGTTDQGKPIQFTVAEGKISELSITGTFIGPGCSSTSTVRSKLGVAISDDGVALGDVPSGPGGISFTWRAEFTSTGGSRGSAMMQLHAIPGPPPGVPGHVPSCGAHTATVWTAAKEGASADERAAAPPAPKVKRCAKAKLPAPAEAPVEPLPGTTRFYLVMEPRHTLSVLPPDSSISSGLRETVFRRALDGDMAGGTYRFGLTLRSSNPQRTSIISPGDPPGKVRAEILLEQDGKQTLLAAATFDTNAQTKRHVAAVSGPDPTTRKGDVLVFRTTWVDGASSVYAMDPPMDSWIEVPAVPVEMTDMDRANVTWNISGQVHDAKGKPVPGVRVMFSPLNAEGKALTTYGPPTADGRMFINNPRPATDAQGRFRVRLAQGFFSRGRTPAPAQAEAVVVDDCGGLEVIRLGEPVRFTISAEKYDVDLGTLAVPE